MAAQASLITCRNGHALKSLGTTADDGWSCDGHGELGGCHGGITGYFQSFGVCRYRCSAGCDYDLCQKCVESRLRSSSSILGGSSTEARSSVLLGNVGDCKFVPTSTMTGSASLELHLALDAVRNLSASCGGGS